MINKTVLIQIIALLCGHIKNTGWLNLPVLIGRNKLGILT